MAADVSVVIPVYNELAHIERTVLSVLRPDEGSLRIEIIVVDNGSTDGSYELLSEGYSDRIVLLQAPDRTVGAVRNHGAARASGSYLLFLDADCCVEPGYFEDAIEVLESTGAVATGSRVSLPPGSGTRLQRAWDSLHRPPRDGFVPYINSGNFFISKSQYDAIGGFDEGLPSGEDSDLCLRLRLSGRTIFQAERLRAYHYGVPGTLREFARQQFWHGMGMFGTSAGRLNKPTLMMFVHAATVIATLAGIGVVRPPVWLAVALLLVSLFTVPTLTVLYRGTRARQLPFPFTGVLLYQVYYTCRLLALPFILIQRLGLPVKVAQGWKAGQG